MSPRPNLLRRYSGAGVQRGAGCRVYPGWYRPGMPGRVVPGHRPEPGPDTDQSQIRDTDQSLDQEPRPRSCRTGVSGHARTGVSGHARTGHLRPCPDWSPEAMPELVIRASNPGSEHLKSGTRNLQL